MGKSNIGFREERIKPRQEEVKGRLRSPDAQQACRATVQMDRMTQGARSKVLPGNDEIDRNT